MAAPTSSMRSSWRRYLLVLAQEHLEFRIPELKSILSLLNICAEIEEKTDELSPFIVLNLPNEKAGQMLMERTVLGKSLLELWGFGKTYNELYDSLRKYPSELMDAYCKEDTTFKIRVNAFNKTMKQPRQHELIEEVTEVVPFRGKVCLSKPEHTFHFLEYYGTDPNNAPTAPYCMYFGRWINDGRRDLIHKYSIKNRHFIGNTSMAADLSLIMANQAKVTSSSLVLDPFVGTGSLLIACAHYGAYVTGTDIDYNVIHGQGKTSRTNTKSKYRASDESIRTNMKLYNMEKHYIDVMVADTSHNFWREQSVFDAIVTDPPYGIREATRRIGTAREYTISDEKTDVHFPSSVGYHLADIFTDLLNFAACYLKMNGRLVYWLPICRVEYSPDQIPHHPCLTLVSNCEQVLNVNISRRLITMEKTEDFKTLQDSSAAINNDIYDGHNAIRKKYFMPRFERLKIKKDRQQKESSCPTNDGAIL